MLMEFDLMAKMTFLKIISVLTGSRCLALRKLDDLFF